MGKTTVTLRPVGRRDIPEFRSLLDSVCRERLYLAFLAAPDAAEVRDFVLERMRKKDVQIVAEMDGRLAGWCDITASDLPGFTHSGRLGMGVLAACRGRGVGTLLLEEALSRAGKRGLLRVELEVFASNTGAINLYRKFGFRIEGRKAGARFLDGKFEDIFIMGLVTGPEAGRAGKSIGKSAVKPRRPRPSRGGAAVSSPPGVKAGAVPRGEPDRTAAQPARPANRRLRRKGKG